MTAMQALGRLKLVVVLALLSAIGYAQSAVAPKTDNDHRQQIMTAIYNRHCGQYVVGSSAYDQCRSLQDIFFAIKTDDDYCSDYGAGPGSVRYDQCRQVSAQRLREILDDRYCEDTKPDRATYYQCRLALGAYVPINGSDTSCDWVRTENIKPTNFPSLWIKVRKQKGELTRGQYETTEQYLQRVLASQNRGGQDGELVTAVMRPGTLGMYDADHDRLIIPDTDLRAEPMYTRDLNSDTKYVFMAVLTIHNTGKSYVGENAFGVKRLVRVNSDTVYHMGYVSPERRGYETARNSALFISMSPSVARVELPWVGVSPPRRGASIANL